LEACPPPFEPAQANRRQLETGVRSINCTPPPNLNDVELVEAVQRAIQVPFTAPLQTNTIRRDAGHNITFDLATISGPHRVVVLEAEKRVRRKS
jgi:hypothetical protein